MASHLYPWQIVLAWAVGWSNQQQQLAIEYLQTENRVLREGAIRNAINEYLEHYHSERNHQGLENQLIDQNMLPADGEIDCRERLGGMLKYYHRQAA